METQQQVVQKQQEQPQFSSSSSSGFEATKELNAALSKAQGAFKPIVKNCTAKVRMKAGGEYSFDYADLQAILEATREALVANGLSISSRLSGHVIIAELRHAGGGIVSSQLQIPASFERPQDLGSILTYYRRYMIAGLLGVASEDDDDANSVPSSGAERFQIDKRTQQPHPQQRSSTAPSTTASQVSSSPGDFMINFGGHRGKKVRDVTTSELSNILGLISNSTSQAWSERPDVKALADAIRRYLKGEK
jgi:hypothetical protein